MKTKKWYQSKAIWGGIVTVIVVTLKTVLEQFGANPSLQFALNLVVGIAGAFGIYGRKVANTQIK